MYHYSFAQEKNSESLYEQQYKNAVTIGTDPNLHSYPDSDPAAIADYRSRRMYNYWKRFVLLLQTRSPQDPSVLAIFDKNGNLVDMLGDADCMRELGNAGIRLNSVWSMELHGPNAVTFGLQQKEICMTVGNENYNQALKRFSICFVPIMLNNRRPPYGVNDLGGIAVLTRLENHSPLYMTLLNTMAHDLILNLLHTMTSNILYDRDNDGVLTLDNATTGEPCVDNCNDAMFEILGIEKYEARFHPLSDLIDPLPANRELWDIVNNLKRVKEQQLTIVSKGNSISCIVSSDYYDQKNMLNMAGTHLFVTTNQRISAQVSEKMGNNAILNFNSIVAEHPRMLSVIRRARMIAMTPSNVMLTGESGVGKDVFAQAIHNESSRRDKPFIAINCGALPRDLIAAELFGYDSGAFTGAKKNGNIGKFELANGGTIFLDEIGELPLDLQATLLRIVEQKRFMRLGSNKEIELDVKIISATNVDMSKMIQEKSFRADLYYRLSTMLLEIPPLRERGNDAVLLAEMTINKVCRQIRRLNVPVLSQETKDLVLRLPWHGNVRELQNTFERAVQLYPDDILQPEHIRECIPSDILTMEEAVITASLGDVSGAELFPSMQMPRAPQMPPTPQPFPAQQIPSKPLPTNNGTPFTARRYGSLTREEILQALNACHGSKSEAAKYLGIARITLYRNMKKMGIE